MPQTGDDRQYAQTDTDSIQYGQSLAAGYVMFHLAMLHTIYRIDIQADEHLQYQTNPSVGRQEDHHAEAGQDAEDRHYRYEWSLESTFHIRHALAHNQDAGTYQSKGE